MSTVVLVITSLVASIYSEWSALNPILTAKHHEELLGRWPGSNNFIH